MAFATTTGGVHTETGMDGVWVGMSELREAEAEAADDDEEAARCAGSEL